MDIGCNDCKTARPYWPHFDCIPNDERQSGCNWCSQAFDSRQTYSARRVVHEDGCHCRERIRGTGTASIHELPGVGHGPNNWHNHSNRIARHSLVVEATLERAGCSPDHLYFGKHPDRTNSFVAMLRSELPPANSILIRIDQIHGNGQNFHIHASRLCLQRPSSWPSVSQIREENSFECSRRSIEMHILIYKNYIFKN